jgi:hypothetical protein
MRLGADGYPDPTQGRYGMTASHCAINQGSQTGQNWGQPYVTNSLFATEFWAAPLLYRSSCNNGMYTVCQIADIMVLKYNDPSQTGWGVIEMTPLNSIVLSGTQASDGNVYGAVVGEYVVKVGSVSGTTRARVNSTCTDRRFAPNSYIVQLCVAEADLTARAGDSGSPVIIQYDPNAPLYFTPRVVGMVIAADTAGTATWYATISQIWHAQSAPGGGWWW